MKKTSMKKNQGKKPKMICIIIRSLDLPQLEIFFFSKRSRRIAIIKARVFNHSNLTGGCIFLKKENKLHNKRMIYVTNRNQKLWWWGWSGYLLVSLKMMTSTFGSTLNAQGAAAADDCQYGKHFTRVPSVLHQHLTCNFFSPLLWPSIYLWTMPTSTSLPLLSWSMPCHQEPASP